MKKVLALVLFMCLPLYLEATLIVNYSFNDNLSDSSGNGFDASGVGQYSFVAGESDQALYINNPYNNVLATQYVVLNGGLELPGLALSSHTIAMKIKTPIDGNNRNGRLAGSSGSHTFVYNDHTHRNSYVNSNALGGWSNPESEADPNAYVTDNSWHWMIMSIDRDLDIIEYFVDDDLISSKAISIPGGIVSFTNFSIGAISYLPNYGALKMSIDDFQIYDHAFTPSQVNQLNSKGIVSDVPEPRSAILFVMGLSLLGVIRSLTRNYRGSC